MTNINDFSFEVSAPSALFLNPAIDDRSLRLFMIIKGLTRSQGYCYATNGYLAQALKTSEPTIKRSLKNLKDEGFIEIQTDKTGIHWQRRIYLGIGLKKCLRRITDDLPPDHGRPPPRSQMIHNNIVLNENVLKEREEANASPTPFFQIHKRVKIELDKYQHLVKDFGEAKVHEMMDRLDEYADINPKRFKQYACHAAVIRKWLREDGLKKPAIQNSNPLIAKQLKERFSSYFEKGQIDIHPQGILFTYGHINELIKFDDFNFLEKLKIRLKKMGLEY